MSDARPPRPKKPLILAVVALAVILGLRAWFAADTNQERGSIWFLLLAAAALVFAATLWVRRLLAKRSGRSAA